MASDAFAKGSTVEVSSNEPGFHGAWYVATLLDRFHPLPTTINPSTNDIRYLVKYNTLLTDDTSNEPLTEVVQPSRVRPLPPRSLCWNNEKNVVVVAAEVDFGMYDVVDAYRKEGWWIGVVSTVVNDGGVRKYVVSFENPPEDVEFGRAQLRRHVDWVDGWWRFPPKKIPESNNDAQSGLTTPSKEAQKNTKGNSEMVGAVKASEYSTSNNKIMNSVEQDSGGKSSLSSGTCETEDGKSHEKKKRGRPPKLRAKGVIDSLQGGHQVTVDLDEQPLSQLIPESNNDAHSGLSTPSKGAQNNTEGNSEKASESSTRNNIIMNSVEQDSGGKSSQSTGTCEAEDCNCHEKKKRGRPPKLRANGPINSLQGGHEITVDPDEQPLSQLAGLKKRRSSCRPDQPDEPSNQATITSVGTTDYQQAWPFTQRSPIWSTIASLELHQTPPQRPHFSPLKKVREDRREGLAIAQMVTFVNLVQTVSTLRLTDPVDEMTNSLELLGDLETHGFDTGAIRRRLNKLLSLKSKVSQHEIKLKKVEAELEKCNCEKIIEEKEMKEMEMKMQELQEKMVRSVTMMKVKEEEAVRLQSCLHQFSEQMTDCELAFKKLAATPLQVIK